jgi:hypothetical protein
VALRAPPPERQWRTLGKIKIKAGLFKNDEPVSPSEDMPAGGPVYVQGDALGPGNLHPGSSAPH